MDEPPANWDQQEEENPSISLTTTKLSGLNVNAIEFVPSFGSGFSFGSKTTSVPTPSIPKTPPSTPIVIRHTNENEGQKNEAVSMNTNQIESNGEQQIKEDFTTEEGDEFNDDQNEGSFSCFYKEFIVIKKSFYFVF